MMISDGSRFLRTVTSGLVIAGLVLGCSASGPATPKDAVIAIFGAMEKDDKAALAHLLDLAELMKSDADDYAFGDDDSPRVFVNPQEILEDLTGDGLTKKRWFSYQRIVGRTEIEGESARVEVTFNDKENSKAYLTKFGLHVVNGKWKVYSFKAIPSQT